MRAAFKRCNNLSRFPLTRTYGQEFSRHQIHKIDHKERYSSVENLDPPIQTAADAINNSKCPKDSVETKRILSHLDWKIAEGASIATAAEILINQKVGALAVYNKIDDIVGVISQRDFINNLQSIEKPASAEKRPATPMHNLSASSDASQALSSSSHVS